MSPNDHQLIPFVQIHQRRLREQGLPHPLSAGFPSVVAHLRYLMLADPVTKQFCHLRVPYAEHNVNLAPVEKVMMLAIGVHQFFHAGCNERQPDTGTGKIVQSFGEDV